MSLWLAVLLFVLGLALVIAFAEKLVAGVVGAAAGFGVSAFWLSVVFIGFDPENLAVGAAGAYARSFGIALGSIIGASMVAVGLALGITAMIVPLKFGKAPRRILLIPLVTVGAVWGLMLDGVLGRLDGMLLLAGYAASVAYLLHLNRKGVDIRAGGEVAETLGRQQPAGRWKSVATAALALAAIIVGSEMIVRSSERIIEGLGWSDTLFGMTLLALLVSIEELARELPAALKHRPDITYGNVLGSVLAFFLFNAGIIALVRPVQVNGRTMWFYMPMCIITVAATSAMMASRRISRLAGLLLVALYAFFVAFGYMNE
ncbi:MAG: sodium:calcium antiporter [Planctomycetes bacterium]|nr:sodium:calcium antiporter [Planctomycetota bacterium]